MNDLRDGDVNNVVKDISDLLDELQGMADVIFKGAVERSDLVLTGELKKSVESEFRKSIGDLGGEISVYFNHYWHYKDMKYYSYDNGKFINVDAIREFVKKIGVGQFPDTPGYEKRVTISDEKKIDRIVRAIVFYRRKIPTVKNTGNKKHQRLFTRTKMAYVNMLRRRIMNSLGLKVVNNIKINLSTLES
jgi:hypothetical protein